MNIWKRGVCLLLTLVMAAALAGCGTRREPQTLRVCLPELPGTLDPAMVTTDSERIVVSHLYENLMKLSSDGQGGSRVEAGLPGNIPAQTTTTEPRPIPLPCGT